jgi:hypothetical protein
MLPKQVIVLGNILIIEISDAEIQQYVKQEGKAENRVIEPVIGNTHMILHTTVDP